MANTACLVCLVCAVVGGSKKEKKAKNVALVVGTQPNLSNLFL
jgi:hypothetical protein